MYNMRPQLPDSLVKRVEEVYDELGYASKTEFVNDAVRRRLEEIENEPRN